MNGWNNNRAVHIASNCLSSTLRDLFGVETKLTKCISKYTTRSICMVDVVPQIAWVLYRINKDGNGEFLPLLAFRRDVVNATL